LNCGYKPISYSVPGEGPQAQFVACRKGKRSYMIKVKARGSESVEQMMKRFKKICEKEGLTRDIKRNSYYEKPSERRRRQKRKSIKRVLMGQ